MLEKLKKRSIKKRIERYVALRDTSGRNTSLQTLGVLVDEGLIPDLYLFEDLPASLGVHPNKFRLFSFLEVKKKLPSIRQNQINNKDFSFKGQVKNNNALEFVEFPFDVLIVFSTNLPPRDLVDEAFLRRLRHKIEIGDPSYEDYRKIFQRVAEGKKVEYNDQGLAYLLQEWYIKRNRKLRASHPRDLCDQILDISSYLSVPPVMSREMIDRAAQAYFVDI
jgi:hypothetical protein